MEIHERSYRDQIDFRKILKQRVEILGLLLFLFNI